MDLHVGETPKQRAELKRRYKDILFYVPQIAAKTGLAPMQILECAAGNTTLPSDVVQKILDAFHSLSAPESDRMPRNKHSPSTRDKPTITPDRGVDLLRQQLEKGRQLQKFPVLHAADFDNWDNTTRNYVEWAFGENHPNVEHFALQEGPTTYGSWDAQRWSDHYKEALHLKIPALVGYIDQLKAMSPPEQSTSQEPLAVNESSKKIFIVHGHDSAALDQLELILHRLDLDPFILQNTAGGGLTIIEVLEKEIGPRDGAARFGIVLLTPDDTGYANSEGARAAKLRARQNVVLEMGMLISALGRPNVAILKKGDIEIPSDALGIIYVPFASHVRETAPKLVDRLKAAGFVLDPAAIAKALL
jgi:predicted nucleotide-binding protein